MITIVSNLLDWILSRSLIGCQRRGAHARAPSLEGARETQTSEGLSNALDLSGSFESIRPFRVLVMPGKAVELSLSLTCADRSNAFQVDPGYTLNLEVEMFKLILCLRSNP